MRRYGDSILGSLPVAHDVLVEKDLISVFKTRAKQKPVSYGKYPVEIFPENRIGKTMGKPPK
jgi:hypothetical protein